MSDQRLDQMLVDLDMVSSRTRAEALIKGDGVMVNGKLCKKPGKKFGPDSTVELVSEPMPWVSRGALKLLAALDHWPIDLVDAVCLDVGASTGGFTEVMLSRGAVSVYSIDTGTDQLHDRIAGDSRVHNLAKTDIRRIAISDLGGRMDFAAIDVSFISLTRVLGPVAGLIKPEKSVVALFKPQFEVGQDYIGKGGIVKDQSRVKEVKREVIQFAEAQNFVFIEEIDSPIRGGDGNQEYLLHFIYKPQG